MRGFLVIAIAAGCGGGGAGLDVEEQSCQVDRFHYVHDLALGDDVVGGEGDLAISGYSFINAGFQDGQGNTRSGSLDLFSQGGSGSSMIVHLEFEDLLANNSTVDARGSVRLVQQGIDAGNCEADGFRGRISEIGDGWKFTLVDLHASPYCGGTALTGSFAGCTRASN